MLGFAVRKRIDQDKLANIFVNSLIEVVENGFEDITEMIIEDSSFVSEPIIPQNARNQFLLIVTVGNLEFLRESFGAFEVDEIENTIIKKFANVYDMSINDFSRLLEKTNDYMTHHNFPSKNILYGMSKAVFHKCDLNQYQESYFKSMNTPNPLFLKRLDELIINFMWEWDVFLRKFKLQ
jgi:hypothetical protein